MSFVTVDSAPFYSSTEPIPTSSISPTYEYSTSTIWPNETVTDDPGKGSLVLNETILDLNVTTTEFIPIVAAATAYATLIGIGIIALTVFIIVLIRGRKRFQEFPFFAIVYHLTAANAVHVVMQCGTIIPIMLLEVGEDSPNLFWYKVGSYLIMITEQASIYFTLLMTVNRFAVFVIPTLLRVFTTTGIHIISLFIWAYINFIVFWNYNYGTIRTFSKKTLSFQDVLLGTNFLSQFFTLSSFFLPIIMLAMYFLIFLFIIKKRNKIENQKMNDRDTSLMVQALIISIALEVVNVTDMLSPFFKTTSRSVQWIWTIFGYCVTIFNQIINPLLFLLFNKMVRGVASHIFDKNFNMFFSEASSVAKTQERRKVSRVVQSSFCCCRCRPKGSEAASRVVTF